MKVLAWSSVVTMCLAFYWAVCWYGPRMSCGGKEQIKKDIIWAHVIFFSLVWFCWGVMYLIITWK